jgi:hypothetical protein
LTYSGIHANSAHFATDAAGDPTLVLPGAVTFVADQCCPFLAPLSMLSTFANATPSLEPANLNHVLPFQLLSKVYTELKSISQLLFPSR